MATLAVTTNATTAPSKALHVGLWIVQGLLAALFLAAGGMKLTTPAEKLAASMPWTAGSMIYLARFIGLAEIAGALGLILPAATRIRPRLTALAALGLTTVMALAGLFHLSRGEFAVAPVPALLGLLAAFVAWGRGTRAPIAPRSGAALVR
jgi:hypothetical protein